MDVLSLVGMEREDVLVQLELCSTVLSFGTKSLGGCPSHSDWTFFTG